MTRTAIINLQGSQRGSKWTGSVDLVAFDADGAPCLPPEPEVRRGDKVRRGKFVLYVTDEGEWRIFVNNQRELNLENDPQENYLVADNLHCEAKAATYTKMLPSVRYTTLHMLLTSSQENWWMRLTSLRERPARGYATTDFAPENIEAQTKQAKGFVPVRRALIGEASMAADYNDMPYPFDIRNGGVLQVCLDGVWLLLSHPS